jgi:hypothetical protein
MSLPEDLAMPGPYNVQIPANSATGPYNVQIPAKPAYATSPVLPDDDPVVSMLASAPAQDSGPYGVWAPGNSAQNGAAVQNADVPDNYNTGGNAGPPNAPASNGGVVAPPPLPFNNGRPSAFDKQPNINDASAKGQVRIMGDKQGRYDGEKDRGVKYVSDLKTRRQKYQVEMGSTMKRRNLEFDTRDIKQHFIKKGRGDVGSATLGTNKKGQAFATPPEWNDDALLWVCAPDPETDRPVFYSHVGRPNRFHHSSMVDGGKVIGAGEWIVRKGKLWKISANSGHYQPTIDFFYRAVLQMSTAFQGDTTVFLYDSVDDKWVDYPIRLFISAPTAGNRYWTHPRAQTT